MAPAPPAVVVPPAPPDDPLGDHVMAGEQHQQEQQEEQEDVPASLALAEDLLHEGALADAEGFAWRVLRCRAATPGDVTRAFCVLLQCDFEARRCVGRQSRLAARSP